eukprot:6585338-Prymnesium_polylepis.1
MMRIVWPRAPLSLRGQATRAPTDEAVHAAAVARLVGIEKDDLPAMRDCPQSLPAGRCAAAA